MPEPQESPDSRGATMEPLALPPVDAAIADPRRAISRWGQGRRILYRFGLAYLVLFSFTYLALYLPRLPEGLAGPYSRLWDAVVPWVGQAVFQADTSVLPNASSDTTYGYVQVFCFLVLALAATAIWTLLDRRRAGGARLEEWLRLSLRLALAFWMLGYGIAKVVPAQFPSPSLDRLLQPFGDSSLEGLLWTFMGASASYALFAGLAEILGGLLLLSRRTALLGALVSAGVLTNVVMLNVGYEVPVKLFSAHLLALAVFLLLPDLGRLASLFLFNRPVEPAAPQPLFAKAWLDRGARVLPAVLLLGFVAFQWNAARQQFGGLAPKPPLYGIWNVEEFVVDGRARPPLLSDEARWRRVVFDHPRTLAILSGDSRQRFALDLDPAARRLTLTQFDAPGWSSTLSYRKLDPRVITLEGTFDGHPLAARLRRIDEPKFRLASRGFRWISERPYNR